MFVQRQFQKYQKRSADDQQISLLLKDFEDADQLLGKVSASAQPLCGGVALTTRL